MRFFHQLCKALDVLYRLCGMAAACFLLLLLLIISLQMAARWTGLAFPGSTAYAGYCMAASSFLAIAYTLGMGAHIRVNLLLNALGRWRRWIDIWCLLIASFLAFQLAWFAIRGTYFSHLLGDISQDQDATPLWVPQIAMSVGAVIAAIAFVDHLLRAIILGRTGIEAETVRTESPEAAE